MIIDVSKIVDEKFVITAKTKEGTKEYVIAENIFIAGNDNKEWGLDSNDIRDMRHDGIIVASLVKELQELENTYIVAYIVDMYLRDYKLEATRKLIIDKLNKNDKKGD